jgi:hypothetical protein
MNYPTADVVKKSLNMGTAIGVVARRHGLTSWEVIELDHEGTVSEATRVWADGLRAKFPERFNAHLG